MLLSVNQKRAASPSDQRSTKVSPKLPASEAAHVRCEQRHFETLSAPFSIVVAASEL